MAWQSWSLASIYKWTKLFEPIAAIACFQQLCKYVRWSISGGFSEPCLCCQRHFFWSEVCAWIETHWEKTPLRQPELPQSLMHAFSTRTLMDSRWERWLWQGCCQMDILAQWIVDLELSKMFQATHKFKLKTTRFPRQSKFWGASIEWIGRWMHFVPYAFLTVNRKAFPVHKKLFIDKTTTRARGWFIIFLHSSQSVECLSNVYTKKGREFSRDVEMCRNILKYFWIPPFFRLRGFLRVHLIFSSPSLSPSLLHSLSSHFALGRRFSKRWAPRAKWNWNGSTPSTQRWPESWSFISSEDETAGEWAAIIAV